MATLYLVSTPIGNLADLSARAGETLASVHRVLAEDTRRTRTLLAHLGLHTPMTSLHAHNEAARTELVLGLLSGGEELALVSDAGTPLISDPGTRLVSAVVDAGHRVIPIPGPSAVLAALVGAGFASGHHAFLGFLPRKGRERQDLLERIASSPETVVLFESPERLLGLLTDLEATCGPERPVAVARELTKLHEEFVRGSLRELTEWFSAHSPRGEITVVVSAGPGAPVQGDELRAAAESLGRLLLDEGMGAKQVARVLAAHLGVPRNEGYALALGLKEEAQGETRDGSPRSDGPTEPPA